MNLLSTPLPPSSGGLEVKALGIVHFAHVPLGYRSDYKSLNAASADLLALQKVQKIFTLLLKFPTKFFLVFDYLIVLLTRFFVSV